jgi:hypothetical protein
MTVQEDIVAIENRNAKAESDAWRAGRSERYGDVPAGSRRSYSFLTTA